MDRATYLDRTLCTSREYKYRGVCIFCNGRFHPIGLAMHRGESCQEKGNQVLT